MKRKIPYWFAAWGLLVADSVLQLVFLPSRIDEPSCIEPLGLMINSVVLYSAVFMRRVLRGDTARKIEEVFVTGSRVEDGEDGRI